MFETQVYGSYVGRILDFDIETRRIGFHNGYMSPDGCEPIVIAWSWVGSDRVWHASLKPQWAWADYDTMFMDFMNFYRQADMVTGHYIRRFDLPILSAVSMELGRGPLPSKLVSDTKTDLKRLAGMSQSQENLGALFDLEQSKFHMNDQRWREAARLTKDGLEEAKRRCRSDVVQHKELRRELLGQDMLGTPRMWSP